LRLKRLNSLEKILCLFGYGFAYLKNITIIIIFKILLMKFQKNMPLVLLSLKLLMMLFLKKFFKKIVNENDKRKYNILPTSQTIKEFEEWAKVFKGF
jgi:hypothetical protein